MLSDRDDPERRRFMNTHRYLITSVLEPVVCLNAATKSDAFVAARAMAASDNGPVTVEDLAAHWNQENRWRVTPHDKTIRTLGFRVASPMASPTTAKGGG